jgi:hypothetical protein
VSCKPIWFEVHRPARSEFRVGLQNDGKLSDPDAETNLPFVRFATREEAEAAARQVLTANPSIEVLEVAKMQKRTRNSAWIRDRKKIRRA